jgi:chemotaxis protein CheC
MAKVLVVDDSRLARTALRRMLEGAGHEVTEADGVASALTIVGSAPPEIVTTDLLMPEQDGRKLLDELAGRTPPLPVVVVSADIQETTRDECLKRGAFAVVDKPVDPTALLGAVQGALAVPRTSLEPIGREHLADLAEVVNVGLGRAAAALNNLTDSHVELSAPQVELVAVPDLPKVLGRLAQDTVATVQMVFRGGLEGCAFLVFPQPSAAKLVTAVSGDEAAGSDMGGLRSATLTEIGNILINSVMGTMANVVGRPLKYSLPVYAEEPVMALLSAQGPVEKPLIVVAKTRFHIKTLQVEGNLLLLFEMTSFTSLVHGIEGAPRLH